MQAGPGLQLLLQVHYQCMEMCSCVRASQEQMCSSYMHATCADVLTLCAALSCTLHTGQTIVPSVQFLRDAHVLTLPRPRAQTPTLGHPLARGQNLPHSRPNTHTWCMLASTPDDGWVVGRRGAHATVRPLGAGAGGTAARRRGWGGARTGAPGGEVRRVAQQMLASNSGKLVSGKIDKSPMGMELEKVDLSFREIWKLMVPTERALQARVGVSLILLVVCRLANIMVPLTFKHAIDILTQIQTTTVAAAGGSAAAAAVAAAAAQNIVLVHAAMVTVGMFLTWKLTQALGEVVRQYLWVAVQSDLKRRISERLLQHLHNLSIRFHVTSKSGQTLQVMDKGTSALESLMELLPFRLFPAVCDVILVCGVFCALNQPQIAAIAGGTILVYAVLTYVVTKWRTKFWRKMVLSEITYKGRAVESLQNFETVKYFAGETHELKEYSGLMKEWQGNKVSVCERERECLCVSVCVCVCIYA